MPSAHSRGRADDKNASCLTAAERMAAAVILAAGHCKTAGHCKSIGHRAQQQMRAELGLAIKLFEKREAIVVNGDIVIE